MALALRKDVHEGEHVVVLEDLHARRLAPQDLREDVAAVVFASKAHQKLSSSCSSAGVLALSEGRVGRQLVYPFLDRLALAVEIIRNSASRNPLWAIQWAERVRGGS